MLVQLTLFGGEVQIRAERAPRRKQPASREPRPAPDPSPMMFYARCLEPGEPYRCLDCSEVDCTGTYGPRQMDEIELKDGSLHAVDLEDQWFCPRCSARRWQTWLDCQTKLPARLKRLRAFRVAQARGHVQLSDQFATAEGWLRDDTIPEEP